MNFREQTEYVGNLRQLFSVRESRLCGGKSEGVRVVDIHNGGDLEVCVAVDRCMDLPEVRFRGRMMNYITPNGVVHPSYYSPFGEGWSEAFAGGLLYTCGLGNIGLREDGDWLRQKEHGCIANTPAQNFSVKLTEQPDGPVAELCGTMHEGMLGGVCLSLTRTIRVAYLKNEIEILDTVKNEGFREAPCMVLYHCNVGYPLLQPGSRVSIPHKSVRPRTEFAARNQLSEILPPQDELEEMCYYYEPLADENGVAAVSIENSRERLTVSYNTDTLPLFVQWKNYVKGEYVMGLEPAACTIDGQTDAERNGSMRRLAPGESRQFRLKFTFEARETVWN